MSNNLSISKLLAFYLIGKVYDNLAILMRLMAFGLVCSESDDETKFNVLIQMSLLIGIYDWYYFGNIENAYTDVDDVYNDPENIHQFNLICEAALNQDTTQLQQALRYSNFHFSLLEKKRGYSYYVYPIETLADNENAARFLLAHGAKIQNWFTGLARKKEISKAHAILHQPGWSENEIIDAVAAITKVLSYQEDFVSYIQHYYLIKTTYSKELQRKLDYNFIPVRYFPYNHLVKYLLWTARILPAMENAATESWGEKQLNHSRNLMRSTKTVNTFCDFFELGIALGQPFSHNIGLSIHTTKLIKTIVGAYVHAARINPLFAFLKKIANEYPSEYPEALIYTAHCFARSSIHEDYLSEIIVLAEQNALLSISSLYTNIASGYAETGRKQKLIKFLNGLQTKDVNIFNQVSSKQRHELYYRDMECIDEKPEQNDEQDTRQLLIDAAKTQNTDLLLVAANSNFIFTPGVVSSLEDDEEALNFMLNLESCPVNELAEIYAKNGNLAQAYHLITSPEFAVELIPETLAAIASQLAKLNQHDNLSEFLRFVQRYYDFYSDHVAKKLFFTLGSQQIRNEIIIDLCNDFYCQSEEYSTFTHEYHKGQAYIGKSLPSDFRDCPSKIIAYIEGYALSKRVESVFEYLDLIKREHLDRYQQALDLALQGFGFANVSNKYITKLITLSENYAKTSPAIALRWLALGYFLSGRKSHFLKTWQTIKDNYPSSLNELLHLLNDERLFSLEDSLRGSLTKDIPIKKPHPKSIGCYSTYMRLTQLLINKKIHLFLRHQQMYTMLEEWSKKSSGCCSGYSPLLIYAIWLEFQKPATSNNALTPRDDYCSLSKCLYDFAYWNSRTQLSEPQRDNYLRVIYLLYGFQNNLYRLEDHFIDTLGRTLSKELCVTAPCTKAELSNRLPEWVSDNKMMLIYTYGHSHGLIQIHNRLFFVDSNYPDFIYYPADLNAVVNYLFSACDESVPAMFTIINYNISAEKTAEFKQSDASINHLKDLSIFKSKNIIADSSKNPRNVSIIKHATCFGSEDTMKIILDLAKNNQAGLSLNNQELMQGLVFARKYNQTGVITLFKQVGIEHVEVMNDGKDRIIERSSISKIRSV